MHHISLTTRDGQELRFTCSSDETLLDAAQAANIGLPAQCRQGSCGACHATVTKGEYAHGPHNADALQGGTGQVLLCVTKAQSDLQVALPIDHSRILFQTIPTRQATIRAIDTIAEQTVRLELELEPDDQLGNAAQFEPGQFMEVFVPGTQETRAYSLSNVGNWDGTLEFLIRLRPGGAFSSFLTQAQMGTALTVRGPQGAFGLDAHSLRPRWFVAGGTGLAPLLSMLRRMAEWQETMPARLFFGVNHETELFAQDILQDLQAQLPNLQVDYCVWKPQGPWQGFTGSPADALREALGQGGEQPDLYLCGPPALLNAVENIAIAAGLPPSQIFSERF